MNIELKPCPFCGGTAEFGGDYHCGFFVECLACGTNDPLPNLRYSMEEVAAAWNTRAERTCRVLRRIDRVSVLPFAIELSCGHVVFRWDMEYPAYCSECGAKVVEE